MCIRDRLWGVRLDVEERRTRTPASVFDELVEAVPAGLSEQRERVLDLTDRVVGAMVEESCAEGKPPEDWDWKGLHAGFQEHFQSALPASTDELGEADSVAKAVYERAEEIYRQKEA